jgi:SAM-dependent methyltransferase
MDSQVDVRQAVWTRYWSHGVAHSCGGSYGSRYEGELAQFWLHAFAGLHAGARMLDIATGNGALPQLLLDADKTGTVCCDAIDLARLAPKWIDTLPDSQRAQILPFPDRQFDMVVSQYGLEYTELDRSVPELLRVIVPGGKIVLIAHHVDARPVMLAATELEHVAWLRQPQGLMDTAAALVEPMVRAATAQGRISLAQDHTANAARDRFNVL